jgi:hypothetical protein
MISQADVNNQLRRFVEGAVSLDDFEDWLVAHSWNMHKDSDSEAQKLVGAVELALAEYSNDHISLSDLQFEFQSILTHGLEPPTVEAVLPLFEEEQPVTTVSSSFPEEPPVMNVVIGSGPMITSSKTRSATGRAVAFREAGAAATC